VKKNYVNQRKNEVLGIKNISFFTIAFMAKWKWTTKYQHRFNTTFWKFSFSIYSLFCTTLF